MNCVFQKHSSPIGTLYLIEENSHLIAVIFQRNWSDYKKKFGAIKEVETPLLTKTKKQFDQYFAGKRRTFDIRYKLSGTNFQNRVWEALATIPYGETTSYKQQAAIVRAPKAYRAIGRTNGLNPISIILPCHRVIGSNGGLTGYGGGLDIKQFLLNLESARTE